MAYDIDMIKGVYARMAERVDAARKLVGRPLTYTEKVLYSHLDEGVPTQTHKRGESYVDFNPDRVAMQDATAQMALLQFIQAGKSKVAVPSTVHCDHLIQAKIGANEDLATAEITNKENIFKTILKPQSEGKLSPVKIITPGGICVDPKPGMEPAFGICNENGSDSCSQVEIIKYIVFSSQC